MVFVYYSKHCHFVEFLSIQTGFPLILIIFRWFCTIPDVSQGGKQSQLLFKMEHRNKSQWTSQRKVSLHSERTAIWIIRKHPYIWKYKSYILINLESGICSLENALWLQLWLLWKIITRNSHMKIFSEFIIINIVKNIIHCSMSQT